MSLQRAYVLLAGLYSLLPVMGVVAIFAGGGTPLAMAHLFFGALGVVGLWGYILNRAMMSQRMWRPLAAVLLVGSVIQLVIMLTMPVSGVLLTWMLTSSIFAVLLAVLLYHYGNRDQPLWATDEERDAAKRLATLLEQQSKVTLVYREPGHENSVNVVKAGNDYLANVTRRYQTDDEHRQETFERRFRHPETLVYFVDKFASISPTSVSTSSSMAPAV
ncbi:MULTISPECIES: hypothetical protein [unclassified Halomonas]|jgi:flagellar basal body-associated protein FliL|uniref:hypothetical protein n=1 Tax=unclassified Halomonas TaxID=2609666 RepID=UPI00111A0E37|nr:MULTISPECIES: hypothetical protein [unclassified Halomonas]MCG7577781.1 hypothetical protein [Halomonas sp. MMH1-48]MCG7604831.1 hypothetical protein [Halomonas sp. MM17-34]MCG7614048.1 hypothetical protein [Halomonas sp. MM17-29]MCG7620950.1 hypothetical protein [Halomonas sp. DSH1-27]TNH17858.1 hypothetical protein FHJ80_09030 [Halomonas sp. BL6]|tara:strand:- start:1355 stop:2008 length:654 start_codon:yes stop_codon:yes gene_type:complete